MRRLNPLVAFSLFVGAPPLVYAPPASAHVAARAALGFAALAPQQVVNGFRVVSRYINADGKPMGARFVHQRSGFTLDLLRIESVPQGFIYVNSWPVSDRGEPHTQEHLLLGKGNRGREVSTLDSMSLAESTAYTEQRRTCYQFETSAGADVFYDLLEKRMGALLHPDYTDEEIRREVRNFGVAEGPQGLRLEEQGTVYNEMSSTYEKPWTLAYREMSKNVYGAGHPLAWESGGTPEALRVLTPHDIRSFHDANYHLANMGMITALPKDMTLASSLARFDAILDRVEPNAHALVGHFKTPDQLPAPKGDVVGKLELLDYPDDNAANPGQVLMSWPADTHFANPREATLADLFGEAFGSDEATNLYKRFVDSKTRTLDVGTSGVSVGFDNDEGHPFQVTLSDVGAAHMTPAEFAKMRDQVTDELKKVAAYPDGSPELKAFNARVLALVQQTRRLLDKMVDSPPGFGFRSTPSTWMDHLDKLAKAPGFDKAVALGPDLDAITRLLQPVQGTQTNIWRKSLADWHLLGVQPYVVGVKAEPALVKREHDDKEARLAAETARLAATTQAKDNQQALARYQTAYDAETATMKRVEAASGSRRFLAHPPLGRDPLLDYRSTTVGAGVPLVASTFDGLGSATTGLALGVQDVPRDRLLYLSALPMLLGETGVIVNGKAISSEEMVRLQRTEILGLDVGYSHNVRTGRCELVLRGSGNNAKEAARSVEWMRRVGFAPNWQVGNLPRLRDLVDQRVASLHQTMKEPEEDWVDDPARAFRHQDAPLQLATNSFLTIEHNLHRLRWRLREAGTGPDREGITSFLTLLAGAPSHASRGELLALLAALDADDPTKAQVPASGSPYIQAFARLSATAKANAREAAKDLNLYVSDLPAATLTGDWRYLCEETRDDLLVGPRRTLAELAEVRRTVFSTAHARMFLVGSRERQAGLLNGPIPKLLAGLSHQQARPVTYARADVVNARLQGRAPGAHPLFVGLVDPNMQSGVFINAASGANYHDTNRDKLLAFLSSKLYAGGGAHSVFMKTWAAGLAYSNGIGGSADSGEIHYYAERCPALPQTLQFVIGELRKAHLDANLVEYAYALAFDDSRAALGYEQRGEAMSDDLVDGLQPAVVKRFREALLALRERPRLAQDLFKRLPEVYGSVLPGLDEKAASVAGATYFVIGSEKQLVGYERYLKSVEGGGTTLYRLYPRDFWLTDK